MFTECLLLGFVFLYDNFFSTSTDVLCTSTCMTISNFEFKSNQDKLMITYLFQTRRSNLI